MFLDYILFNKRKERENFEAVISCLNIFGCYPPNYTEKDIIKFQKKYKNILPNRLKHGIRR